jgi:hypothetical protein
MLKNITILFFLFALASCSSTRDVQVQEEPIGTFEPPATVRD